MQVFCREQCASIKSLFHADSECTLRPQASLSWVSFTAQHRNDAHSANEIRRLYHGWTFSRRGYRRQSGLGVGILDQPTNLSSILYRNPLPLPETHASNTAQQAPCHRKVHAARSCWLLTPDSKHLLSSHRPSKLFRQYHLQPQPDRYPTCDSLGGLVSLFLDPGDFRPARSCAHPSGTCSPQSCLVKLSGSLLSLYGFHKPCFLPLYIPPGMLHPNERHSRMIQLY